MKILHDRGSFCQLQCDECAHEFWVDACDQENLIVIAAKLVAQCPECGKIDLPEEKYV